MLDIDLNLLTHLAVLLETRSVTQAARRMRVSQPAMSRTLAELRSLLGDPLLVRTRGGMLLTRRAEELSAPLRDWLASGERLLMPPRLDPARLSRRFRIVCSDHGVATALRPAFPLLRAEAPGVALDLVPHGGDIVARLAGGEVDLAVTGFDPDRSLVHERHLFRDGFVCVARAGHPLARRAEAGALEVADLVACPHVTVSLDGSDVDPLSRLLRSRRLERNIVATAPYFAAAREFIAGTDAITTLPARYAATLMRDPELTSFAAPAELGGFDYWLIWHNRGHADPALAWLVDLVARAARGPDMWLVAAE